MSPPRPTFDAAYFERLGPPSRAKALRARYWDRKLLPDGGRLLDLGAGLVRRRGRDPRIHCVTLDVSTWALQAGPAGRSTCADVGSLPLRSQAFDAVTAFDVLEHTSDPGAALREIHRVLAPGAGLVISVPNSEGLSARLAMRSDTRSWVARTDPTHLSLLTPAEWHALIAAAGLSIVATGTDVPWASPYHTRLPRLQHVAARALSCAANAVKPVLPWTLGENLLVHATREA